MAFGIWLDKYFLGIYGWYGCFIVVAEQILFFIQEELDKLLKKCFWILFWFNY